MTNLTHEFLGRTFTSPLMNAAGVHCESISELRELQQSAAGTLITKTATLQPRQGNQSPRYADLPFGSLNAMGLPNFGLDYYLDFVSTQPANGRQLFLSVTGFSTAETLELLHKISASDFQGITELNLSCPNVEGHPQLAYDFAATKQLLQQVFNFFDKPLGIKLPPYFDLAHFDQMATIINQFPIAYVNCINSIGNGLFIDPQTDTVVTRPKTGFGGIGGAYVKPTALANVWAFHQRLESRIAIIGTGGVRTGRDVYELLLCGASMVQVGTQLHQEGVDVFARLETELQEILTAKKIDQLTDMIGQLQTL
ncbi:dihydroorotate oxidase [Lapidilactobacillus mulanensis]|uniref:dihydroorotate oxidase (fumarate) n=1 Tax=Lapidilactobacillus mulanensis TaxID=2485999 RepID=A0ABW4DMG5_9LACO|nr:dihydroorotate oxidase [Lapidilactobacillus mulanensis]